MRRLMRKMSKNKKNNPKILIYDIETAPNLGYIWGKYQQDVIDYHSEWYIMCFCAKWLDNNKVIKVKLTDFPNRFKKDKQDDYDVVKKLWELFDEADVIIAHNGQAFDTKKATARFLYHNMSPPSPYKQIDTKLIAKRYFNFNSNRLDDIGRFLKVGRKISHEGFPLWLKCMNGDKAAWNKMIRYNVQDVLLLERIYYKFRPYITNHPNYGVYQQNEHSCPNCGSEHLQRRGFQVTKVNRYQRWQCQECGAWSQSSRLEKEDNLQKPKLKN